MFCPPPTLISTSEPIFEPEDPGFEAIVGNGLGNSDAFLSGLDAILAGPLGAIANDISALSTLDTLMAAASFVKGAFDATVIAPLIAEYATLSVAGDALMAALAAGLTSAPPIPSPPHIPSEPPLTVEILCGPCVSSVGGGAGGGGGVAPPPVTYCPGYGYITGTCIPSNTPPNIPPSPIPPGDQGCLNPSPGGGFVPGPCPQQPQPPPEPPPEPPPPEPPAPPEPPPKPGDGGGSGITSGGSGEGGDPNSRPPSEE